MRIGCGGAKGRAPLSPRRTRNTATVQRSRSRGVEPPLPNAIRHSRRNGSGRRSQVLPHSNSRNPTQSRSLDQLLAERLRT